MRFEMRGLGSGRLGFTGEELDWLLTWWTTERERKGADRS